jgi:HTH-type transcriptional regulator/antitoxin HigA
MTKESGKEENDMSAVLSIEVPTRHAPYAGSLYYGLIKKFPLNILENESDHKNAKDFFLNLLRYKKEHANEKSDIAQINAYMSALKLLILDYEKSKFQIKWPSPSQMLKELMRLHGLKQTDLKDEIGAQPHVSRILNGERDLSIQQIKALSKRFNVDPILFIGKN